ncbi:ATP-binding cassette domain-containing protein, partial [Morganella morganii]
LLNNEDHTRTPPASRPVSMLFQENNLFAHLTAEQNIALGFHPGMKLNAAQKVQLAQIAEQVSLTPLLKRLPSQLSGGQRQRVALARCLVRSQPVLLLDEPFSALDPALRNEMLALLETICDSRQLTLMMVSHNTDDAARIAPRAMVVDNGTIAFDGSTAALVSGEVPQAQILGIRP